jgi:hypothetical protein
MEKGSFLTQPLNTRAEEQSAREMLTNATTRDELVSVWWRHCESITGEARDRLAETYADMLRKFTGWGA